MVFKGERLVDVALRHVDIVDVGLLLVARDGENIDVVDGMAHHFTLGAEGVDEQVFALHFLCLFKLQLCRQSLHFFPQTLQYSARFSLQNLACLGDVFLVFLHRLSADTGASTVLDMVVQAHAVSLFFDSILGDGHLAGTGMIQLFDELQNRIHRAQMRVGAIVTAPLLVDDSGLENARKHLVGDADTRIGFAVFQQYVILWIVFLDQTVFE